MPNQPTSFRFPFNLDGKAHEHVVSALRYSFNGLKDLNDAIKKLNTKVNANTGSITNITNNTTAGGGSTPAPPAPAFGSVNLQPNLTPGAYSLVQTDLAGLILVDSAIPFALTLDSGLLTPFFATVYNFGAGAITATPTLGNVNNLASVTLTTGQFGIFYFDGIDWWEVFNVLAQTTSPVAGEFLTAYDAATGVFTQAPAAGGSSFLTSTTTLNAAAILTMQSIPVQLVAAPGVGKVIQPFYAVYQYKAGAIPFFDTSGGVRLGLLIGSSVNYQDRVPAGGFIDQLTNQIATDGGDQILDTQANLENGALFVSQDSTGGDFSAGDGSLVITVYYAIVTLV